MSYSSRSYRQRNAHTHDEKSNDAFFGKQHDDDKTKAGNFFQDRLHVNKPNDQFEKEADSAANAVVNKSSAKPVLQKGKAGSVQRLSTPAEDEKLGTNDSRMQKDKEIQEKPATSGDAEEKKKKPVQKMDNPEKEKDKKVQKMDDPEKEKDKKVQKMDDPEKEKKKPVQTKQDGGGATSPGLTSKIEDSAGSGNALPGKSLKEMNQAFGKDFSDVKIHHDTEAAELNKELGAQAFTHGKDIYFNDGKYDTENTSGKNLLAHELTHVVQQNSD